MAFNEADAEQLRFRVKDRPDVDGVLLVLDNPVPDEIPLILSVDGLLAARGGSTSHAAVAVHGITDKAFSGVLGVSELRVHPGKAELAGDDGAPAHPIRAGDVVSIHGQTGEVFVGARGVRGIEGEGAGNPAISLKSTSEFGARPLCQRTSPSHSPISRRC